MFNDYLAHFIFPPPPKTLLFLIRTFIVGRACTNPDSKPFSINENKQIQVKIIFSKPITFRSFTRPRKIPEQVRKIPEQVRKIPEQVRELIHLRRQVDVEFSTIRVFSTGTLMSFISSNPQGGECVDGFCLQ
jgi:hypothetical protein